MDEVLKEVKELRREVKALRRELRGRVRREGDSDWLTTDEFAKAVHLCRKHVTRQCGKGAYPPDCAKQLSGRRGRWILRPPHAKEWNGEWEAR